MYTPLVSIIIVNWNGRALLQDCLTSLSKVKYKKIEIILVDNASIDNSVDFVKNNYPNIHVIVNEQNVGVAGGFEAGLKKVSGEATLLLNTDTIVGKSLLTSLVETLYSEEKIGAVQPKLVLYPDTNKIDSIGCFFLPTGDLYHFGREKNPDLPMFNKKMEIFSTKGACMLVRTEVLYKTGLFDKDFFAYFEDTDFCMRILLAGYKILYDPKETVYHRGGATSKHFMRSNILFHAYKNRMYTYLKNFSKKYLFKVLPLMLFMYQVAFVGYICTGKFQYALATQQGILWNLIHLRTIFKRRKYVQEKIRRVQDDTFMPSLTKSVSPLYYWYQFFGGIEKYVDTI